MAYKGKFKPINTEKYLGDADNIVYRSLWELKLFKYLDNHPHVEKWASEEIVIRYFSPVDKKMHRYFPDVFVVFNNPDNNKKRKILIEVKPYKQTLPPDSSKKLAPSGRPSRRYINECRTYATNKAKWEAAIEFCIDQGWEFKIMTEKELGIKNAS